MPMEKLTRIKPAGLEELFALGSLRTLCLAFGLEAQSADSACGTAKAESARRRSDSAYGARATPRSQIMPEIRRAGVTSKAGFAAETSGAIRTPRKCVTSSAARSSIGIFSPDEMVRSNVETGAAT